ncbi:DUF6265 family protein [Sphingopyxis sp. 113P3]|uniref:DUF6265 family protein n=1 Tax=Sphingopyxis sp. (strain 113P3) TaxID=292913 RepID=UPI0006BDCF4C|nr:DUF6265 family protein [Sphingopyxis sp. 113P3]ALC13645.1 hypothetical protein LH20_16925 [Sphingopyxis sp. 113P3]
MRIIILGLAGLLSASPLAAADSPESPRWMTGAWEQNRPEGQWADEYWTPPRGGLMIGAARIGKGDKAVVFEHMRIIRRDDGTLVFLAQPFGRPAVEFPTVDAGSTMIEFANPAHDYPQRIRYWREGDRLKARISRMDGSQAEEWDYGPMGGATPAQARPR